MLLDHDPSENDVLLWGDLNAHTLCKDDLVDFDFNVHNGLDLDSDVIESLQTKQTLIDMGLITERYNSDTKIDNGGYGEALVELCRNHQLVIFNGRAGYDKFLGKATTTDNSVIDYVIGSPALLRKTQSFNVRNFDPLFSDKHCAIQFSISRGQAMESPEVSCDGTPPPTPGVRQNLTMIGKWAPEKSAEFAENIDAARIQSILMNGDNLPINNLIEEINSVLLNGAADTFGKKTVTINNDRKVKSRKTFKYKFSESAKLCRSAYHRARKAYNKNKSQANFLDLQAKSKLYKKEIQKVANDHKTKLVSEIKFSKKNDSRKFWAILNSKKKDKHPVSIQQLLDHFKEVSVGPADNFSLDSINDPVTPTLRDLDTNPLNKRFTEDEVKTQILKLKNGKAAGNDRIINEYMKHSVSVLMPLYLYLFNRVLDEGQVPEDWLIGLIIPLYKNKGDKTDCNNYRGITLLSCFGKLFTAILNTRLYNFCEQNNLISEMQAGFRSGYSTLDHLYLVQSMIELFCHRKKKLYAAFVDYAKAFDTVSREALWYKLLKHGIDGKILKVIRSLYTNIKSCVSLNSIKSEFFASMRGVRQGENLSPLLFSLFVNDLENFLQASGCHPVSTHTSEIESLMKIMVLMYADDTIILSDSAAGLQKALDALHTYCATWQLQVNCSKTKVVVFGKRKFDPTKFTFKFNGSELELVHSYKYLGLTVSYNGSFKMGVQELTKQASRAMYALLAKCRSLALPIDIQLYLFDTLVKPILLYGCEIWGHQQFQCIERLHLKFMKYILGVKLSTCNSVVYGELGRQPLSLTIKIRMINYGSGFHLGSSPNCLTT